LRITPYFKAEITFCAAQFFSVKKFRARVTVVASCNTRLRLAFTNKLILPCRPASDFVLQLARKNCILQLGDMIAGTEFAAFIDTAVQAHWV